MPFAVFVEEFLNPSPNIPTNWAVMIIILMLKVKKMRIKLKGAPFFFTSNSVPEKYKMGVVKQIGDLNVKIEKPGLQPLAQQRLCSAQCALFNASIN